MFINFSYGHAGEQTPSGEGVGKLEMGHILSLETVVDAYFSPGSEWIVYTWKKPLKDFHRTTHTHFVDSIFLASALYNVQSEEKIDLEIPQYDSIRPGPWSPDGKHLVLFSLNTRTAKSEIGVYNVVTRDYKKLPGTPSFPLTGLQEDAPALVWLDNTTIIYSAGPDGLTPAYTAGPDYEDTFHVVRRLYGERNENLPQYLVWESGRSVDIKYNVNSRLLKVNITTGKRDELLDGDIKGIVISPSGKHIAVFRRGSKFTSPNRYAVLPWYDNTGFIRDEILVVDVRGMDKPVLLTQNGGSYLGFPVSWADDGMALTFYMIPDGETRYGARPYLFDFTRRAASPLVTGNIELFESISMAESRKSLAKRVFFLNGKPVVISFPNPTFGYGKTKYDDIRSEDVERLMSSQRGSIWSLSANSPPRKIFEYNNTVKAHCWGNGSIVVGGSNSIYKIALKHAGGLSGKASVDALNAGFSKISSIICGFRPGMPYWSDSIGVIGTIEDNVNRNSSNYIGGDIYKWISRDGQRSHIFHLTADDSVLDMSPDRPVITVLRSNGSGDFLLVVDGDGKTSRTISKFNDWKETIDFPVARKVQYTIPGDPLKKTYAGWYILPENFEEGRRYPVVAIIYPGKIYGDDDFSEVKNALRAAYYQPLLAAQRDIITFYASTPLFESLEPFDIPQQLTDGTLAAVDALIATGVADPDRLILHGHSGGGFAIVAVLTRTNRFVAAIATAGVYNFTSAYGTFERSYANHADIPYKFYFPGLLEGSYLYLRSSPWKNPDIYIRNSPIFSLDKIDTPLLIIHSDFDYVPVMQAEELFTGLVREGKSARFIKLIAEHHVPTRPEHVVFTSDECFAWIEKHISKQIRASGMVTPVPER